MTRATHSEDVDRGGSQIPAGDPIAPPGASYAVALNQIDRVIGATTDTAVEMPVPWKSQHDFHRTLEISHSTRDSHISTADARFYTEKNKPKDTTRGESDQACQWTIAGHWTDG
jgi:hypothetical protein